MRTEEDDLIGDLRDKDFGLIKSEFQTTNTFKILKRMFFFREEILGEMPKYSNLALRKLG